MSQVAETGQTRTGKGNPQFAQHMSIEVARLTLSNAVRGQKTVGGGTKRVGMILRGIMGYEFGHYRPSDLMKALRSDSLPQHFLTALNQWKDNWDSGVNPDTQSLRESEYKAARAFCDDGKFAILANAIESILAARATGGIALEDESGNPEIGRASCRVTVYI